MKRAGLAAIVSVLLLNVAILIFSFYLNPVWGDEGVVAMDGWRISRGEVPQRDFFQFIPPLAGYVQALSLRLFSESVFALRIVGFVYGLLLVALSYLLYREFIRDAWVLAGALALFVKYGAAPWLFGSHHWLCDILQIAGALLLLRALRSDDLRLSLLSGAFLGLSSFALQDQGAYCVAGLLLASVFASKRRHFLAAAGTAVAAFLALSLPFLLSAGPAELMNDWVLFPLQNYKSPEGNRSSIGYLLETFVQGTGVKNFAANPAYTASITVAALFLLLSPLLAPLSLLGAWFRKLLPKDELLLVAVFSLSFLVCAARRLTMTNLSWAFPLALLPFFVLADRWASSGKKASRSSVKAVSALVIAAMAVFALFRIGWLSGDRVRVIATPRGEYRTLFSREAVSARELLDAIANRVEDGEPMFCAGFIPLVGFVSGHPNPTRFNFVLEGGYYSEEQVSSWLRELDHEGVRWGYGSKAVMDREKAGKFLPSFEVVFENSDYLLFRRKGTVSPEAARGAPAEGSRSGSP